MSKPVLAIGGLAVAAALFGGGLVAGRTFNDDAPSMSNPDNERVAITLPGPAGEPKDGSLGSAPSYPAAAPANESAGADAALGRGGAGSYGITVPASYYGCEAPLGPVVVDGRIDPSAAGIEPRLLGAGFELVSINLRGEGECNDQGRATEGKPVLETQWRHTETGVTVWMAQRILGDPVANVRWDSSASVVADGYFFTLNAWNNVYYLADKPAEGNGAVVDSAGIAPPSEQDPAVAEVLGLALQQIAPGVAAECYYTQTEGSWSDLAAFGVGDPRSAIPSGYSLVQLNLLTFAPPAAGCDDNGAEAPTGDSFWAQWQNQSTGGYIEANVYRMPDGTQSDWPGSLDDWGANWISGNFQFSVWGNEGGNGLGQPTISAIARALDPSFTGQCLISTSEISAADLAGLGVSAPATPDGFNVTSSRLIRRGLASGCPGGDQYTSYELAWTLESTDGAIVEANGYVSPKGEGSESWGYVSDFSVEWGRDGTSFSIWGKSPDGEPMRETMLAIATSIDPSLDVDSLQEGGGPRPLPADGGGVAVPEKETR